MYMYSSVNDPNVDPAIAHVQPKQIGLSDLADQERCTQRDPDPKCEVLFMNQGVNLEPSQTLKEELAVSL